MICSVEQKLAPLDENRISGILGAGPVSCNKLMVSHRLTHYSPIQAVAKRCNKMTGIYYGENAYTAPELVAMYTVSPPTVGEETV